MAEPAQRAFQWTDDELLEMPVGRFWGRLERHAERQKAEEQKWLMGLWLMSRSVADVNFLDRDPPYHEKEKPKKSEIGEVQRARASLQAEQGSIQEGLKGPSFFGKRYGLGDVFGDPPEPEKPEVLTAEEIKKREREAEASFVEGLRRQVESKESLDV